MILSFLYTLIIAPLELLFEIIFTVANRIIGNSGLSIIVLSLVVNFLVLPLYKRADELQAEERDIQSKMASGIKHIKKVFKGDERFFMLQEYYRINHYKPVYALKSTASLLLQVPFFIAAYNLLSGMQSLQGMQFGFISDLGREDALFMVGSFPVNVLPILMTLINVVSGIIYTKGHPFKEKVQVFGLAAVFLVLLYRSPSGLVFYWLLNNVFSLLKNVFLKIKNSRLVLGIIFAFCGFAVVLSSVLRKDLDARQKVLLSMGGVLLLLPLIVERLKDKPLRSGILKAGKKDNAMFITGTVFMALLTGLLIPSAVIYSASMEFIDEVTLINPSIYILNAMLLSFGSWVLWGGVFYAFMNERIKVLFCKGIWLICGISVIDYMLFGTDLGLMSNALIYDVPPEFRLYEYLLNSLAIILAAAILLFIYMKIPKAPKTILAVGAASVIVIGAMNLLGVHGAYTGYRNYVTPSSVIPEIPLSKNGKNVIVLMLDRACGTQVPYIFNEKPELIEEFDGFTYYPNSLSYGGFTNTGSPALFGGYEYTPENMNKRDTELLEDKHDEALMVMPVIFGDNGYEVTICDPAYAGYEWVPDLSIYDDHPEFNCYLTNGTFNYFEEFDIDEMQNTSERLNEIRNRNFYCFALMKISPLILQQTLYNDGLYNEAISASGDDAGSLYSYSVVQKLINISQGYGYNLKFLRPYTVLYKLPEITAVNDSDKNTFLMMCNDITHETCILQEPDYEPALVVDNSAYDQDLVSRYTIDGVTMEMKNSYQISQYQSNVAAFILLSKWFDYLRENGVYDNTRIIIVSDHGRTLNQFGIRCEGQDMDCFIPLLMVKDFNASGFTVCEDFMTNGDTPVLATDGLIEDPVNPFTGNPITSEMKNGPQTVLYSEELKTDVNNGTVFLPGAWYTLTGNPHNPEDWTYVGVH